MKRLVLDTNTIISALFWQGNPRKILDIITAGKYIMLSSAEMEHELIRVLGYPKFGLTPKEIYPINIFLECAIDGNADYIISGDHLI